MANLQLKCTNCGRNFFSGIEIGPNNQATFIHSQTKCNHCGFAQFIPDGSYKGTADGAVEFKQTVQTFISIIEESSSPIEEISRIFEALKNSKTTDELELIKKDEKYKKYEKWLPNSPEKIAAYLAIVYTTLQLLTKNPNIHIEYNTFVNQYNEINITDIKK